jgi:hypothetical protein
VLSLDFYFLIKQQGIFYMVYALTKNISLTNIAGTPHPVGVVVHWIAESDYRGRREKA